MITRVALKINDNILIGLKNARHESLYTKEVMRYIMSQADKGVQGFITDEGGFLDRKEAGQHALDCGQIMEYKVLISEDLW